jgi:hypothetical protein
VATVVVTTDVHGRRGHSVAEFGCARCSHGLHAEAVGASPQPFFFFFFFGLFLFLPVGFVVV